MASKTWRTIATMANDFNRFVDWRLELHRLIQGNGYDLLDPDDMRQAHRRGESPAQYLARSTHPAAPMAQALLAGYQVALPKPYAKAPSELQAILIAVVFLVVIAGAFLYFR